MRTFIKNEEQNFSLFNYVNEQSNEIEKLEEAIQTLREEEVRGTRPIVWHDTIYSEAHLLMCGTCHSGSCHHGCTEGQLLRRARLVAALALSRCRLWPIPSRPALDSCLDPIKKTCLDAEGCSILRAFPMLSFLNPRRVAARRAAGRT